MEKKQNALHEFFSQEMSKDSQQTIIFSSIFRRIDSTTRNKKKLKIKEKKKPPSRAQGNP